MIDQDDGAREGDQRYRLRERSGAGDQVHAPEYRDRDEIRCERLQDGRMREPRESEERLGAHVLHGRREQQGGAEGDHRGHERVVEHASEEPLTDPERQDEGHARRADRGPSDGHADGVARATGLARGRGLPPRTARRRGRGRAQRVCCRSPPSCSGGGRRRARRGSSSRATSPVIAKPRASPRTLVLSTQAEPDRSRRRIEPSEKGCCATVTAPRRAAARATDLGRSGFPSAERVTTLQRNLCLEGACRKRRSRPKEATPWSI